MAKHMEVQAEAWPTASRTCGEMGQWQSPIRVPTIWMHSIRKINARTYYVHSRAFLENYTSRKIFLLTSNMPIKNPTPFFEILSSELET